MFGLVPALYTSKTDRLVQTARDMTTFSVAGVLRVATAVIAGLVPSIRAARVDPVAALRAE